MSIHKVVTTPTPSFDSQPRFLEPPKFSSVTTTCQHRGGDEDHFSLDPISLEPMTLAVIDQAGHTFDQTTIYDLRASAGGSSSIICPIGREIIDTDRLVPNLLVRQAVETGKREKERAAQPKASLTERVTPSAPSEPSTRRHELKNRFFGCG